MWVRSIDENDPRASVRSIEKGLSRLVEKERKENMDRTLNNISANTSMMI